MRTVVIFAEHFKLLTISSPMIIMLLIVLLLFVIYTALLIYYWRSWKAIPVFEPLGDGGGISISVIIPARNEEAQIGALLQALETQTYPSALYEVVVVDDHSSDATATIASQYKNVKVLSLKENGINSYKKKAIEAGIAASTGDLIVTTDADCIPANEWLATIASFKKATGAVFIASPVKFSGNSSILQVFQVMDFMVLQGITGAAVSRRQLSMCNGANLAYDRKVFIEAGGFKGIDHIASGDDMLLMHKIARLYPSKIFYLKSTAAIVETKPMQTWKAFLHQRIRWASKATHYTDARILPVLLLVYLLNLSLPVLLIAGCWDTRFFLYALAFAGIKTLIELPLFITLAGFFNKQWTTTLFPLFQPLHIAYTLIAGFLGQSGKYEWKGRKVK